MSKTRMWYIQIDWHTNQINVSDLPFPGFDYRVRTISWHAAGRRLLRNTVAEHIAKLHGEWDNPNQPQYEDTPAKDRVKPHIKDYVKQFKIVRIP